MTLFNKVILILLAAASVSCGTDHQGKKRSQPSSPQRYAEHFTLEKRGSYTLVSVSAPWQNASKDVVFRYVLGKDDSEIPDSLTSVPFIKTPVDKVALYSTTFISHLLELNEKESLKGIAGIEHVYHPEIRKMSDAGLIKETGTDRNLNYELLIDLQPDVVFLYGIDAGITRTIGKMKDLGLQPVLCPDYLESHPLGRAEWIRFFGAFFEKTGKADQHFERVRTRYEKLAADADKFTGNPSVFMGLPWKESWYIAGGNSFAAQFIEDAGGDYVWDDLETNEALPYDLETVFRRVLESDIWLNPGDARTLNDIRQRDDRFTHLQAFQSGRVYNNNKRLNEAGGNDYWESGLLRPDRILNDLIHLFHETNPRSDSLFYYQSLK